MNAQTVEALKRGVAAGLAAGVPQVLLTKAEEKLFLPPGEDADIGPHFVEALADRAGKPLPEDFKWLAASAFHFGYAAFWGGLYGLAYQRRPVHPALGGLLLGGLIYGITFPSWGAAVLTGAERRPSRRTQQMELVLATAAFTFGVGTALLYGRGARAHGLRIGRWRLSARS